VTSALSEARRAQSIARVASAGEHETGRGRPIFPGQARTQPNQGQDGGPLRESGGPHHSQATLSNGQNPTGLSPSVAHPYGGDTCKTDGFFISEAAEKKP